MVLVFFSFTFVPFNSHSFPFLFILALLDPLEPSLVLFSFYFTFVPFNFRHPFIFIFFQPSIHIDATSMPHRCHIDATSMPHRSGIDPHRCHIDPHRRHINPHRCHIDSHRCNIDLHRCHIDVTSNHIDATSKPYRCDINTLLFPFIFCPLLPS